jgi:hypothetical protein
MDIVAPNQRCGRAPHSWPENRRVYVGQNTSFLSKCCTATFIFRPKKHGKTVKNFFSFSSLKSLYVVPYTVPYIRYMRTNRFLNSVTATVRSFSNILKMVQMNKFDNLTRVSKLLSEIYFLSTTISSILTKRLNGPVLSFH